MNSHLKLFSQVPIGYLFTFETPDNIREFAKLGESQAYEVTRPDEWSNPDHVTRAPIVVNPGVLVFAKAEF